MDVSAVALNRFGLGARPGERGQLGDPRAWLLEQLKPQPAPAVFATLPKADFNFAVAAQILRRMQQQRPSATAAASAPVPSAEGGDDKSFATLKPRFVEEARARVVAAADSATSFHERLVWFWSNHFTVAAVRLFVVAVAGRFEREAIRPNVGGRFFDLLLASTRHPAMLCYLNNDNSAGANAPACQLRRGVNENLAREVLELHTLGVDGGYTQADVTEFARALTGWAYDYDAGSGRYVYVFRAGCHEPGDRTVLGKRYPEAGEEQATAILRDLARHPATARHLAAKLARHLVADDPPPTLVGRLAKAYLGSDGDLSEVGRSLIQSPEAWQATPAKFRRPDEFVVATLRATGMHDVPGQASAGATPGVHSSQPPVGAVGTLHALGQMPFEAPSPQGWSDQQSAWLSPGALLNRLQWAAQLARLAPEQDARRLARDLFGAGVSQRTLQAIEEADSPQQGLTLLLMSPEFQRR